MQSMNLKLCIAFVVLTQALVLSPALAQDQSINHDPEGVVILTDAAYLVPSFLTMLWVHETGHYTFAVLCGAQNPRMGLYRTVYISPTKTDYEIGWTA